MTETPPRLFDRQLLARRRNRAAPKLADYNFLVRRAFDDMCDRVDSITRDFDRAAILGGGPGLTDELGTHPAAAKIGWLTQSDLAGDVAARLDRPSVCLDEEALPFAEESLDLVLAPWGLHWTNDLPGVLVQINHALKPDGFFAAALLGGSTLTELRQCLMTAESELTGGASARVSPYAGTFDMAALLQRAGFAMPVADIDRVTVRYDNAFALMADLRGMGETSVLADRPQKPASRALFVRTAELYAEKFADPNGRIRASFDIIHAAGWAPHPDQPKPKRPGSATHRLADALGVTETSLGEKAGK
ncbi:methyltransferase domain-containing protein [Maricaulis parjimensis]|uniref:methyltransferase domain-containing protein n=1 Tax=Maricaulis parjimensis TaxID=144023 RepID=UPI0019397C18|nr:methyltransferase domain-containing protein [Maricaulis parjimensis]